MSKALIPDDVAQFILERIESVAQMEALLLLRGEPEQQWCVDTLAKRLYIDEKQTEEILGRLCADGLLVANAGPPARYKYQPNSTELRRIVERVTEIYSKHLVPVTNLIHSKPKSRVQEFADAFKLRKDE